MTTTTANLGLFKYDPSIDGLLSFSVNRGLNDNWDKIDEFSRQVNILPSQIGNSGKYLMTNGTNISWEPIQKVQGVVETYVDGTSWYRVWSDGWCEQGGYGKENIWINLLKSYNTDTYNIYLTRTSTEPNGLVANIYSQNRNSFMYQVGADLLYDAYSWWKTEGYIN